LSGSVDIATARRQWMKSEIFKRENTMHKILLISMVALIGVFAINFPVFAQSGWQSNGMGGVYGTGNNSGGGWQSNGMGGMYCN
jgi:hypothetical protein